MPNCDKTGLTFSILPKKTLDFEHKTALGYKESKDTLIVCSNTVSKLMLLLIIKSVKSTPFKCIAIKELFG